MRSSRLNSSSCVARSFGSGKLAASSFMCSTVRSTSTIRSRFQFCRMRAKCSNCSLFMYCSPRRAMYGFTLRGPASRLAEPTDRRRVSSSFCARARRHHQRTRIESDRAEPSRGTFSLPAWSRALAGALGLGENGTACGLARAAWAAAGFARPVWGLVCAVSLLPSMWRTLTWG